MRKTWPFRFTGWHIYHYYCCCSMVSFTNCVTSYFRVGALWHFHYTYKTTRLTLQWSHWQAAIKFMQKEYNCFYLSVKFITKRMLMRKDVVPGGNCNVAYMQFHDDEDHGHIDWFISYLSKWNNCMDMWKLHKHLSSYCHFFDGIQIAFINIWLICCKYSLYLPYVIITCN